MGDWSDRWRGAALMLVFLTGTSSVVTGAGRLDDYELTTDRPDLSESAVVVPPRVLQIESGLEYSDVRDSAHTIAWTRQSLLRYGLKPGWELRFGGEGFRKERTVAGSQSGLSDLGLGFKRDLPGDNALIVQLTLPVGKRAFSSGRADYGAILAMDRELPRGWQLGLNLGGTLVALPDDDSRFFQTFVSAAFAHALGGDYGGFVDLYAFLPAAPRQGQIVSLQVGVTKLLKPHLQLDFYVDVGLSGAAKHRSVAAGVSYAR